MGSAQSDAKSLKQHQRVLMLGLDGAGKTTLLSTLSPIESKSEIDKLPTIGFNVETVKYKQSTFTMWDIGGQHAIRPLWRHYYSGTDALIFVVDASDRERLKEAQAELESVCKEECLKDAVLLVFANKFDLADCCDMGEVAELLNLQHQKQRQWYVQPSVAITGLGVYEGLGWMIDAMKAAGVSEV